MFIKNLGYKNTDFRQKFLFIIQKKWNRGYNKYAYRSFRKVLEMNQTYIDIQIMIGKYQGDLSLCAMSSINDYVPK